MDRHVSLRAAKVEDTAEIVARYRAAAAGESGLARAVDEISPAYVAGFLGHAVADGIALVAVDERAGSSAPIVGEIHAYHSPLAVFAHVLGELTIAVHPAHQGRGVGRALFAELLRIVRDERPAVERVELITRESNARAIALYESLGFRREGRLERRIRRTDGLLEADVPMGWLRARP